MAKFEEVTMYRTGDAKVFPTQKEALEHHIDMICEMFENIIKPLDVPSLTVNDRERICEAMYAQREHIAQYINYFEMNEE